MGRSPHAFRIIALSVAAACLLFGLASNTAVMFNDGLRYVRQARAIDAGAWSEGLLRAVDHPIYPLLISVVHRFEGGTEPDDWQRAAQWASCLMGVLLVTPLYLVALELFGDRAAWLAVLFSYAVPISAHVFADVLSESTFLFFWTFGLWTGLRFMREGAFFWLPAMIGFSAAAYLTRPEGLLLPAAAVLGLAFIPFLKSTRLNWPRWWAAASFLVLGPILALGPFVIAKGGLGTKPAIARFLGTAPKSAPMAVERERPLDPDQSTARTIGLASRAVAEAVRDSVTPPFLLLSILGFAAAWLDGGRARALVLLTIILVATALALLRLHATGGYCTPRHALVIALPVIAAAARGFSLLMERLSIPGRLLGLEEGRYVPGPGVWMGLLLGLIFLVGRGTLSPINQPMAGYRLAGEWLSTRASGDDRVVDLTGLSQFYSGHGGYTFANLTDAPGDASVRWLVAREAHLKGPWPYCEQVRALVGDRPPVGVLPASPKPRQSLVYVFDLGTSRAETATAKSPTRR